MAVPGQIKGLWEAKKKYGNPNVSWKSLIQPSIDLCLEGIPVSSRVAIALKSKARYVKADPGMSNIFINPSTGDVWKYNDIFSWQNLATTYEKIANNGGEEFYSGETMEKMVEDLQSFGSVLTKEDFLTYRYFD